MKLFMALLVGLFTLVGSLILLLVKDNKKIVDFSISLGFGVLVSLILFELIPESIELVNDNVTKINGIVLVIILMFGGIFLLKVLDIFIPDHGTKDKDHLSHIGFMTMITLIIHNFIEGIALYSLLSTNPKMGLMLGIGVALHNIPLGMTIASLFSKEKKINKIVFFSLIISLSTFVGGFITYLFKGVLLNDLVLGIVLSITLGMLVYIVLFELLGDILKSKDKKLTITGIILGIMILIASLLLG